MPGLVIDREVLIEAPVAGNSVLVEYTDRLATLLTKRQSG